MAYETEFGADRGTLWSVLDEQVQVAPAGKSQSQLRKDLRNRANKLAIVWFVDDEKANRQWFVKMHRQHFAVVTFSSRDFVSQALNLGVPCDIVVTDVFFAANTPASEKDEQELLRIYDDIEKTTIANLPALWPAVRKDWVLSGFDIARDVAAAAERRKETIPVVLFSRKAPLLLTDDEWLSAPHDAVKNTFWMTEKVDPMTEGQVANRIAGIQRDRLTAYLELKQKAAPWWMKVLAGFSIKMGPFVYSLAPFKPN